MTQNELNRAVARATRDSLATIERLGFRLAEPGDDIGDADFEGLGPQVLDLDEPSHDRPEPDLDADREEAIFETAYPAALA